MTSENRSNHYYNSNTVIANVAIIGFFAGIMASFTGIVVSYFNLLEFSSTFILTSWTNVKWASGWQGMILTVFLFGIISIVISYLYYFTLKKFNRMSVFILYGLIWWAILLFLMNPMFKELPAFSKLSTQSIITSLCMFILYGVFVGYSISYDYDEYTKEQQSGLDGN